MSEKAAKTAAGQMNEIKKMLLLRTLICWKSIHNTSENRNAITIYSLEKTEQEGKGIE